MIISAIKNFLALILSKRGINLEMDLGEKLEIDPFPLKDFGDYSTNIAFLLAPIFKQKPQEISDYLIQELQSLPQISDFFTRIKNVNGFINFYLSPSFLEKELYRILQEKTNYGRGRLNKKTVVIDYSSPNIARVFGVGHLRSTVVGQAIYNLYQFSGWYCIGDNHLGDWGTQFGVLIYQLEKLLENKNALQQKKILKKLTLLDLERLYIEFHKQLQTNPQLQEKARECFLRLEKGEKKVQRIWKFCLQLSKRDFRRIYRLLKVKFDYYIGESFYRKQALLVFQELKKKNLVTKSQGAFILEFTQQNLPPAILLKSDGTTTYFLRDLATIKYRLQRWHPKLIIYEVGMDQTLYFQQLFTAVKMLGWDKNTKFIHLAHGLIRDTEGKLSTRQGRIVHLEDVLLEAKKRAANILTNSLLVTQFSLKEKEKIAYLVALGAVKYNILSYHFSREIVFDWEKMINFKGNSGPYLQYTYVRCSSILKKVKDKNILRKKKIIFNPPELDLLEKQLWKMLVKFPEVIEKSTLNFSPNILCDYLYKLSTDYNIFYQQDPVLKAPTLIRERRIALTKATLLILKQGLTLLGIPLLSRM